MDYNRLADLLFPNIDKTPDYWENKYKDRQLPNGADVTRIAPSPTGFVHFGTVWSSLTNYLVAKHSNGVFYLRVEDTDKKREVEGGVDNIIDTISTYLKIDEGVGIGGEYGPYIQSQRVEIYQTYAKDLIRQGKAYPCFCSENDLNTMRQTQENLKENFGYYGKYAKCRNLSYEQIEEKVKNGDKFVIRFKCPYTDKDLIDTTDLIRGDRRIPQNANDVVIIKSDGIPPYNFAHAIDDHLMHTTKVMRGDEWLPSMVEHIQLFEALGFKCPEYAHLSPIQKVDENGNRRKLSKRKDPEANMAYYTEVGYPVGAVIDYMMNLINSDYEDWRLQNPKADILEFPFKLNKMSVSGSLFDIVKLNDISKNYISRLTAQEVYDFAIKWAGKYDKELYDSFIQNKDYWLGILNIDRDIPKPRKDLSHWSEIEQTYSYMFDDKFDYNITFPEQFDVKYIKEILQKYPNMYNAEDEQSQWFDRIKDLAQEIGFAREVKEYKQNPENYPGHCGDVSTIIRVALTGRTQTPNLYDICRLLGQEKIKERFNKVLGNL